MTNKKPLSCMGNNIFNGRNKLWYQRGNFEIAILGLELKSKKKNRDNKKLSNLESTLKVFASLLDDGFVVACKGK